MLYKHRYKIALLVSLLLHVLVIWFYKPIAGFLELVPASRAQSDVTEPLVFEFEQEAPKEVVETPEDARVDKAPQDARYLSDKNARAQDMYASNDLTPGDAYSEGNLNYKLFAGEKIKGDQSQTPVPQQERDIEQGEDDRFQDEQKASNAHENSDPLLDQPQSLAQPLRPKFSKELLFGNDRSSSSGIAGFTDDANWNNQESSAESMGGISLSTYEWDFAPYIQYMKKTFRDHFYPPAALYHLGIIEGYVTVRYTVQRNGLITDIQLRANEGHETLVATTMNMIKASSPLKPLPGNFPDDVLTIDFTFIYSIRQ